MVMLAPRTFRALFWCAAVFAVVMALIPQPPFARVVELSDKVQHILAFAVLAGLANLGFRDALPRQVIERLSFLGAAIEVMQSIPVLHRDCEPLDWIADTVAAALVTLGFVWWRSTRSGGGAAVSKAEALD